MPSELARLLRETAPNPSPSLDPDQIWTTGRRRRRRRQLTLGVAVIALAGLATAGTTWLARPESESDRLVTADGGLVTAEDPVQGFTVQYPASWRRASTTLTPDLSDPVEILSLGTSDLAVGGGSCAQFPVAALEAMSSTDAFLTVQERRQGDASFPLRPEQFPPSGSKNISEVVDCLAEPAVFDHWWFAFEDAGRTFHVLVAIGTDASQRTRADTWQILEGLKFDSQPDVAVPSVAGSPRFLPAPGWEISRAGLTAANIPLGPNSLAGAVPWDTVERLEDGDVVLFAMLVPVGETSAVDAIFPPRELPLSLNDGQPGGLEGQPDDIYADRLLAQVDGWNIDLLVFYGGGDPTGVPPVPSEPSAETRAGAQEQLERLVVPARETPELSRAPEDACRPSNLQATVHLDDSGGTLAGHINVRNIGDSACTLEGRAQVVEPRDANAVLVPSTMSEADPAWQGAGDGAPDGWPTMRIAPGSEAEAVLRIRNWCVEPGQSVYFHVRLPYAIDRISGVAPSVRIPPQCEEPQAPMELALGPFEPPRTPG
jgi:hypothetical protein